MSLWRRNPVSGLVVLAPFTVILYILAFFYNGIMSILHAAIVLSTDGAVAPLSKVLGLIISIIIFPLLVLSVGYLTRTAAGRLLESGLDAAMNEVPFVRIVYNASKLTVETALTGAEDFQKPVRLKTWSGIRMTAFRTGKMIKDGKVIAFVSTALNITTRFVMEVNPEDAEETGEKVEEALTRAFSVGFAEQNRIGEFNIEITKEPGDGRVPSNE